MDRNEKYTISPGNILKMNPNKKILTLGLLMLLLVLAGKAQSTFNFLLSAQQRITSGMAIDDGSGGIIALVNVRTGTDYSPSNYINAYLLQISSTGDTLTHRYSFHDTTFIFNRIHRLDEGGYFVTGESRLPNTQVSHLLLARLDSDFNMLWAKHYFYEELNFLIWCFNIFQDGDTLIMPLGRSEFPGAAFYPMLIKTDLNGNILHEVLYYTNSLRTDSPSYMYDKRNGRMWMFARNFVGGFQSPSRTVFGRNFELLYTEGFGVYGGPWRMYTTWDADSNILMSYIANRIGAQHQDDEIWLAKYDTSMNRLYRNSFGTADTMENTPFLGAGVAFTHYDTIYFSGFKHVTFYPPSPSMRNWIVAGQTDAQLNPRFIHYIGGDQYYETRYMLATSDGGFVIQAGVFNHKTLHYDLLFLKLNNQGLITGNSSNKIVVNRAFISPNPAKEHLKVECMLKQAEASVLTLSGAEIFSYKLEQGTTNLPIQNLKPGMYLLKISTVGKGVIETHKFIKQ